ncbi:PLP-dependent aminotransferase family protein [Rarobacter faecitabidus]|uniref:DNA-binding transcriptional MocR family regulator n=1 Tax=Rarobacter faecitabidus TaxID=13243 RepID=A0A542ZTQ6_RARFA|nr:PLP-dependent aminotransferase family protein [Rarobacter faecitabidus]TQL63742.1 DNA-binding transcriptional MocR family regulator [Rarobacter faecitabidus]
MFSQRIDGLRPSPIRSILNVIERPGMVSFAGGLPATDALPSWSGAVPPALLQYGRSEGEPELRAAVSDSLRALGVDAPPERVMILSGSQQGIDLTAKLFVDPGTTVAVEYPTYLAALQVLRFYGAEFADIATSALERVPLGYVVPTFANPTGACMSETERDRLAETCLRTGTAVFEDDPYRELAYEPCDRTPIVARMVGGTWIYQGSFSKTFAPGLRLGYLAASEDLFEHLVAIKQATDLHSSRLSQRIVFDAITDPGWPARLAGLVSFYRSRRDAFEGSLRRHFDGLATWDTPPGGLFYWLRLQRPIDTRTLLADAIENRVAFMPGEEFSPGQPDIGTMRLNFSHASADDTERGLRTLARILARAS